MLSIFAKASGLTRLIERCPAGRAPAGDKITRETVQIGPVRYRRCADIYFDENGFFLEIKVIFNKYPLIYIPWTMVKAIQTATLYGLPAARLVLGEADLPPLTFYKNVLAPYAETPQ